MGDERHSDYLTERRRFMGVAPDPAKAQAERRANVRQDERDGLLVEAPWARNTDPETSHTAAQRLRASGVLAAHQRRVLEAVRRWPGFTYVEIGVAIGMDKHAVMRRLGDLQGGERRLKSGRTVTTPCLVRKGYKRACGIEQSEMSTWWPA